MSTGTSVMIRASCSVRQPGSNYVSLRDADENRNTRMTFDRGRLELMSPTRLHERVRILIGHCLLVWFQEMQIRFQSCGSMTFRREDLQCGLEPDNCYYIKHEAAVRDREELDLTVDPPPDLAIEVDITSSSINRLSIYAAFGVPEIWRWHDEKLTVYRLGPEGDIRKRTNSQALPGFSVDRTAEFIRERTFIDEMTFIDEFRRSCLAKRKP